MSRLSLGGGLVGCLLGGRSIGRCFIRCLLSRLSLGGGLVGCLLGGRSIGRCFIRETMMPRSLELQHQPAEVVMMPARARGQGKP